MARLRLYLSRAAAAFVLAFALAVLRVPAAPALPAHCEEVYGACVLFDADFPPDARSYVLSRVREGVRRGVAYWGGDLDSIAGWNFVYHGYWALSEGRFTLWGETIPELRRMDVALKAPLCPETVLVHELGHVLSVASGGDGRPHGPDEDPRFNYWGVLSALAGMPGCEP